jgi:hypothetical protein
MAKNCKLDLLILKNRARLEKLIASGSSYDKILEQSRKLDVIMQGKFLAMNNKPS